MSLRDGLKTANIIYVCTESISFVLLKHRSDCYAETPVSANITKLTALQSHRSTVTTSDCFRKLCLSFIYVLDIRFQQVAFLPSWAQAPVSVGKAPLFSLCIRPGHIIGLLIDTMIDVMQALVSRLCMTTT
jgi:hypothetical protein